MSGLEPIAIVTGAAGQDGYYLIARLLRDGASVHATVRAGTAADELRALPGAERLTVHEVDVTDTIRIARLLADVQPDEIYNLAGMSSVRRSFDDPAGAWRANADAVHVLLEAVRTESPATRFYQASSTDMFGSDAGETAIHDEASPFRPQSPYAAAKAAAHLLCRAYRAAFDLRIACGILSNHESARRPASFLTSKVAGYVRDLRAHRNASPEGTPPDVGSLGPLRVGNLSVRREWGFAPDYVEGMVRVCRQVNVRAEVLGGSPDLDTGASYRDYVLGTGNQTAVWELIDRAFSLGGFQLEWDRSSPDPAHWTARFREGGAAVVVVDPALLRPADPATIGTDPSLARRELGWRPSPGLDAFLEAMLGAG